MTATLTAMDGSSLPNVDASRATRSERATSASSSASPASGSAALTGGYASGLEKRRRRRARGRARSPGSAVEERQHLREDGGRHAGGPVDPVVAVEQPGPVAAAGAPHARDVLEHEVEAQP